MRYIVFIFLVVSLSYANSQQGDKAFQEGNYKKAIEYYKKSTLKEDPLLDIKLAQAYTRLGDNFSKIYNFKEAKKYYHKAISKGARLAKFKLAKLYEKEADLYYKNKKYKLALDLYNRAKKLGDKKLAKKIKNARQYVLHQKALNHDTRKVVDQNSPLWTKAIGRLIVPTKINRGPKKSYSINIKKCSATLVNFERFNSSKVIVTASHCLSEFDKSVGLLRFLIKSKEDTIIEKYVTIYKDSNYNHNLKTTSDYAILILNSPISRKDVEPVIIDKRSFSKLKKEYKYHFGSLAGFSSDIGDYGSALTYDPKCEINYYNKFYGKSNCSGYKGASGGPVILTTSKDNKKTKSYFVGVVSHFRGNKYNHIYFSPHHIFYPSLKKAIEKFNN